VIAFSLARNVSPLIVIVRVSVSWVPRLRQRRGEQDEDDADQGKRKWFHESADNYG
jgi:hypothetical protein